MGKWTATEDAYYMEHEEKVIPEKNKMGLVQALTILHQLRDAVGEGNDIYEAFQMVFCWIDEMVLLLKGIEGDCRF